MDQFEMRIFVFERDPFKMSAECIHVDCCPRRFGPFVVVLKVCSHVAAVDMVLDVDVDVDIASIACLQDG